MNGVVFQTSTRITAVITRSGSAVHAIARSIKPSCMSRSLMMPYWSCSIQPHILAETIVGIAHGTSTAARTSPRARKVEFNTRAMPKPSSVSMLTDTTAK